SVFPVYRTGHCRQAVRRRRPKNRAAALSGAAARHHAQTVVVWLVGADKQDATGLRNSLAVGDQAIGDLLAVGNEFRADSQRVKHAGLAAPLLVVGSVTGNWHESKADQQQHKCCADSHRSLLTSAMPEGIVLQPKRALD